jgi:hypothetical protein
VGEIAETKEDISRRGRRKSGLEKSPGSLCGTIVII